MKGKDPAALFYINDWLTATKGMKAEAKGWYLNLILFQFEMGELPSDIEELANLCDVRFSEFDKFKQVFEQVLKQKFKLNENNCLENTNAKSIIQSRELFKHKRSNSGKLSYFLKFINENYKVKKPEINFIKKNVNLTNIDLKNKQVLKQVFKQTRELYINENENENISEIINENENEKVSSKDFKPNNSEIVFNTLPELQEELINSETWLIELAGIYNITTEEVVIKLNIFLKEQNADENIIRPLTDIKRHFRNYLKLNIVKEKGSLEKPTYKRGKSFPIEN